MTPPQHWIKNIRMNANKIAKITCHIFFLQNCLALGLSPVGLTLKPAITGLPPNMRENTLSLARKQSLELTRLVLDEYQKRLTFHKQALYNLVHLISKQNSNLICKTIHILNTSLLIMDSEAKRKLKKLSELCMKSLRSGKPLSLHTPKPDVPLIADRPSLASLLNIPTPVGQKPYLPPVYRPKQPSPVKNSEPQSQVFNISSHVLSEAEKSVLTKGLTFCPTPRLDHFALVKDVLTMARSLRLKYHFATANDPSTPAPDTSSDQKSPLEKFKPPSNWDPPPLPPDHPIEQYINFLVLNISDTTFEDLATKNTTDNLSPEERRAISSLKNNQDIRILPADKGSTTVVMNTSDYTAEIEKQLSDTHTYRPLNTDPTQRFSEELTELIQISAIPNKISQDTIELLIPEKPTTPKIYILPKIHKGVLPPPGRPIVAGCGSLTERASAYVDSYLQPFVHNLTSYIKDTYDFLDKLNSLPQPLPHNSILATIDVSSLYTSIPNAHGLSAIEHFLQTRPKGSLPTTHFIVSLAQFILEKNYFQFKDKFYLQTSGTAMGTKMAPSYANLYMGRIEEKFLKQQPSTPLCWFRYIDDIFIIWTHGPELLENFLKNLNNFCPLKFTWETSEHSATFLDVNIELKNGFFSTSVHIKPTNHQQYLHFDSCHPRNTKRSLPYSLALRGQKITSDPINLEKYNNTLLKAFENRGYPPNLTRKQIRAAQEKPTNTKKETSNNSVRLVTTYHPGLFKLNHLLKTGFRILQSSPQTKNLLNEPPNVTYRQPPNLRNLLVRPKLPNPSTVKEKLPAGSYPCNSNHCKTCKTNPPSTDFTSSTTKRKYKIEQHHTCNSENLIYQLQCKNCPAQYIGLTTETLRKRMNGHRHDTKTGKEKPVAQHAASHNMNFDDCYTTKAIRSIPKHNNNNSTLRRWELAYQHITGSRNPPNLNLR
jgi:hypothetical protein